MSLRDVGLTIYYHKPWKSFVDFQPSNSGQVWCPCPLGFRENVLPPLQFLSGDNPFLSYKEWSYVVSLKMDVAGNNQIKRIKITEKQISVFSCLQILRLTQTHKITDVQIFVNRGAAVQGSKGANRRGQGCEQWGVEVRWGKCAQTHCVLVWKWPEWSPE